VGRLCVILRCVKDDGQNAAEQSNLVRPSHFFDSAPRATRSIVPLGGERRRREVRCLSGSVSFCIFPPPISVLFEQIISV
jgi:hypothetical protein